MNISPANILMEIASFRSQALSSLMSLSSDQSDSSSTSDFAKILGMKTGEADSTQENTTGRNMSLRDPEAAYDMMTQINKFDVTFKAQFSELSQLGDSVEQMEAVGGQLSEIDPATDNAAIQAKLQDFVSQYNTYVDRFTPDVQTGGMLDNVQAAEISLYELEQSVTNMFNGATDGVRGMGALGISIDPVTHRASLDSSKLDSVLASNKSGAVNAIDEFSANFAKSADLLNAKGNFIPNSLDNRGRAIQYISDNIASLQSEFGTGDSAKPTGQVARALAAYENAFGIA
jgi:hypothetical protein